MRLKHLFQNAVLFLASKRQVIILPVFTAVQIKNRNASVPTDVRVTARM